MTLTLPAQVTLDEISAVLRTVHEALDGAGSEPLQIDASAVQELDTSAVALLLQAERLAAARGRRVELLGLPDKLCALARLYGVESLLVPSAPAGSARSGVGAASV